MDIHVIFLPKLLGHHHGHEFCKRHDITEVIQVQLHSLTSSVHAYFKIAVLVALLSQLNHHWWVCICLLRERCFCSPPCLIYFTIVNMRTYYMHTTQLFTTLVSQQNTSV